MKKFLYTGIAIVALFGASFAYAYVSPGVPSGYVNDFAKVLSESERTALETSLNEFHTASGGEISVVTVSTLGGDEIEEYANALFRDWGIGQKDKNNGVLLLVAMEERTMRIEVGYGYEGELTDARSSGIIRNTMTPLFKEGKYGEGITKGTGDILDVLRGNTELVDAEANTPEKDENIPVEGYFFLIFIAFSWLSSVLGRTKSWWLGGVFGGIVGVGIAVFAGLSIGVIAGAILIPLGLFFDYIVSKGYSASKGRGGVPPWWTGGGGFGGGGGGGGFGGFSGGSSGGGGSSGRW